MRLTNQWKMRLRILLFFLVAAGIYSTTRGQDIWWDNLNYHLYNPFSLLQGTWGSPTAAAGTHSFLNPLPDLYYYFFFTVFFKYPRWLAFFMGLPWGLLAWQVYCILLDIWDKKNKYLWTTAVLLLTVTASGISSQIGVNTNEILLGNFVLASFWLMCVFVKAPEKQFKKIAWAAFICGAAAGMKLTIAPFCVALLAGYLLQWKQLKHPFKGLCLFALSGLVGFLVTDGYFMWKLYVRYGNPIFPYYNNIFHSPYFDPIYLADTRKFPKTWLHKLLFPFFWAFQLVSYATEENVLHRDMRLAFGYIAVIVLSIRLWTKSWVALNRRLLQTILVYSVVGYVLWLTSCAVLRYAVMLEFWAVLLLCVMIDSYQSRWKEVLLVVLCAVLMGTTVPQELGHFLFRDQVVDLMGKKPTIEDNSLVWFVNIPTSYLAPILNKKATYMGNFRYQEEEYPRKYTSRVESFHAAPKIFEGLRFEKYQQQLIANHQGPIYIVSFNWPMKENAKTWEKFGLTMPIDEKNCKTFTTNFISFSSKYAICRAVYNGR